MTRTYELIAFDMDGTLLDSKKEVLPSSVEAIRAAGAAGKSVAICSGRCPSMVMLNAHDLPGVRYAICGSGAVLFDLAEDRVLRTHSLTRQALEAILAACREEDVLVQLFSGRGFFYEASQIDSMAHYGVGIYQSLCKAAGTPVDDPRALALDEGQTFQKLNLHFATVEARSRVRARMAGQPVEMADSEVTGLEFSPLGVNKGTGLVELAELLDIPREATIAVGDADNDLDVLRAAGLGLAMANANEAARAAADLVLERDNDHGGCAEAVRRFLLGEDATDGTPAAAAAVPEARR